MNKSKACVSKTEVVSRKKYPADSKRRKPAAKKAVVAPQIVNKFVPQPQAAGEEWDIGKLVFVLAIVFLAGVFFGHQF